MAQKPFDGTEIIRSLNTELASDVIEAGLAALANVVRATPVGNPTLWQNPGSAPPGYVGGHARRNWNVSLTSPKDTVKGSPGDGGGEGAATSDAINSGRSTIERFKIPDRRIIIQNNVPYITRLNAGHSTQAPANFAEKAVQAATRVGAGGRKDLP